MCQGDHGACSDRIPNNLFGLNFDRLVFQLLPLLFPFQLSQDVLSTQTREQNERYNIYQEPRVSHS